MRRPRVQPYTVTEPPGVNVHVLRNARGWSLQDLASACDPPLDFTTVSRVENNDSYSRSTLERLAAALDVPLEALFTAPELIGYYQVNEARQRYLATVMRDALAAQKAEDSAKGADPPPPLRARR